MTEQNRTVVTIEAEPLEVIEAPVTLAEWLEIAGAALSLVGAIIGAS